MKKTKGVTKYESEWQLCRVSIKGSNFKIDEKISKCFNYFKDKPCYNRWERVYNWAEGLLLGLKKNEDKIKVLDFLEKLEGLKPGQIIFDDTITNKNILINTNVSHILLLWNDLLKTNDKWLSKGYFHKECNYFIDLLYEIILERGFENKVFLQREILLKNRTGSMLVKNEHVFFF